MTEKAKEIILPHVRELIKCITHLEQGDDKFSHYEHHIFSSIWNNKFITVDRYAVRKSIDGVIKKFMIHSRLEEAEKLRGLVDKFLNSKDFENNQQYDIQWYLLSLLLHLSHNPTSASCTGSETIQLGSAEEEEEFDWPAYLLEGQPDVTYLNGGSETEDECYSSDELQEEYSIRSEENFDHDRELPRKQLGESCQPSVAENATTKGILWGYIEERANAAEKWLKENVQHPSVEGYKARSKFASANLAEFWEAQQKGETDNALPTQLLSEYRALREVLWALQVPPSFPPHLQDDWKGLFLPDGKGGYRVRPAVTIPSLTKGSFQSHLRWLGRHVSLVKTIESFIDEIFSIKDVVPGQEGDVCFPPHTYEAYASALKEFLSFFKEQVLTVEKKVKSQESTCTLLTVSRELEPILKELRLVHGIHQKSICNWKQNSSWYCACRLLTMLYGPLLSSLTDVSASICFQIFLKTFQPYLDIIHVWLTEGRLEDWRGEFIITKNEAFCGDVENFWNEGFVLHPYEDALLEEEGGLGKGLASGFPLGLLHLIKEKVLLLGKNMELLQRLGCLSEFQKISPLFERTLHDELKRALEYNLQLYVAEEDKEEANSLDEPESCDCKPSAPDSLSQTLVQELQNSHDYYLKKTFEDIVLLPDDPKHSRPKEMLCHQKNESSKSKRIAVPVLLPIKPMIESHLCKLLEERHSTSSTIVRSVLLGEYALTAHLLIVRRIFLMEAGDLIHHFCSHLFQQAEMGEMWKDSLSLTNYLQECVSARYPDSASLFSISLSTPIEPTVPVHPVNSHASSAAGSGETWLEQVDRICLNYAVEWPVNIVLNAASMESYNTVFQFLLKVRWALWSLQQLRFSDLTGSKVAKVPVNMGIEEDLDTMPLSAKIHRLQLLRAWLLHFVGSVHAYLMGRVLHGLGMKLEADLESACDLDAIIHVHEKYIETVYCQCLQPKTADIFKTAILRVLDISMTLSSLWKQPSQLTSGRLCEMENQYIRCHVFLANVLTNAVQRGFVRHMETLSTALVHSFPSH